VVQPGFPRPVSVEAFSKRCELDAIATVVTDVAAPPDLVKDVRQRGIEVIVSAAD
jgi:DeoR/GlpR family transcriptional regulator of sugar metabolism